MPVDTQRWLVHTGAGLEVAILQPKPKTMTHAAAGVRTQLPRRRVCECA